MSKNISVEGWCPMELGQVDQKIKCVSVPLIVTGGVPTLQATHMVWDCAH